MGGQIIHSKGENSLLTVSGCKHTCLNRVIITKLLFGGGSRFFTENDDILVSDIFNLEGGVRFFTVKVKLNCCKKTCLNRIMIKQHKIEEKQCGKGSF